MIDKNGKRFGWFFTKKNVFENIAFKNWLQMIPEIDKKIVLEPFAGKNTLVDMLTSMNLLNDVEFQSFDIFPRHQNVIEKDTLKYFPSNFPLVMTNPPFIAKNSATRKDLDIMEYFSLGKENYDDLYEVCLEKILENTKYAAVILPETFLKTPYFKNRLHTFISLAQKKIFDKTEHPACLALFQPEDNNGNYRLYHNEQYLGMYKELKEREHQFFEFSDLYEVTSHNILKYDDKIGFKLRLNCPHGQIGLIAIDATEAYKKIHFCAGDLIDSADVNQQSRLRTRFHIEKLDENFKEEEIIQIIRLLNQNLKTLRETTHDIFLTSFKGMNNSMMYRRRLDFVTAKKLIIMSVNQFLQKS